MTEPNREATDTVARVAEDASWEITRLVTEYRRDAGREQVAAVVRRAIEEAVIALRGARPAEHDEGQG